MSAAAKGLLAGLALAVLAGAGGWWLCHAQGVSAAQSAAEVAAAKQHVSDSVNAILRGSMAKSDSVASAAKASAEMLSKQQVAEHIKRVAADLEVASATLELGQAKTAADSFPIYRDKIAPGLRKDVASLNRELALSDSTKQENFTGWQSQIVKAAALQAITHNDSLTIREKNDALAKAAKVSPVVFDTWQKLGYAGETAGFGLATVTACQAHLASLGCIVGTALSVRRLIASKGKLL